MAKSRADDALCIDCLHLFTLLFLNYTSSVVKINDALLRKIEIQFRFFFLVWRSRSFINKSQQFLQRTNSRDVFRCDRRSVDSPYIFDESTGMTVSKKLIILF